MGESGMKQAIKKLSEGVFDAFGSSSAINADAILEAIPTPVLVVDENDTLVLVNQAAEQFFAASANALLQASLQDLIPHDSPVLSLIGRVRRKQTTTTEYGVRLATPRIGEHSLSIHAAPVPGSVGSIALVLQPTSIAEQIDETLTQQGAVMSITGLSQMLGHEVKNPLSGIRGAAQLLEGMISPEDRGLAQLIIRETDRIVKLVDQFDDFAENPQLDRDAVNIHEVLNHVVAVAKAGFASDIAIKENFDPSLPPVFGNHDQLVQVFLNLVKNAAEAINHNDGEIRLKTEFRHGVRLAVPGAESRMYLPMVVTVRDNGPGVPEDMRPYLFDPFVSSKKGGAGLGLALAAKLVGDHGGLMSVESRPRRTEFSVMLPLIREVKPVSPPSDPIENTK